MWGILIGGEVILIALTYLLALESGFVQMLLTIALAGSIGAVLFLVHALDRPFSGIVRVAPDPLVAVRSEFLRPV